MATVTVMDKFSPSKNGPGHFSAKTALDEINQNRNNWNVTMVWNEKETVYTSAFASKTDLKAEVRKHFSEHFEVL
ncbi:hypothetical protein [Arachidicoccus sp.]|uniref:hypothetical protein n=1 Tax=Arachidicoccus sp. TaxID=1872624 RepID=UPI003D220CF8